MIPPAKQNFAFVEFATAVAADDAVKKLDGKEICGQRVVVEIAHSKCGRSK
jgi:RNA recognition motif-containing protein